MVPGESSGVLVRLKDPIRRIAGQFGFEIRRRGTGHDSALALGALFAETTSSPAECAASQRLLAGLSQFLAAGAIPRGQLLQDALAVGDSPEPGFFIEVGAGHPTELSNVAQLIDVFSWEGIRVDPNPEFASLHRSTGQPNVTFCEVAVGEVDGSSFDLVVAGELSSRVDLAKSDGHSGVRTKAVRAGRVVGVQVRRLDSLLSEIGVPDRVAYLSLDTEGSELEVLRTVPFQSVDIDVITVEHNFRPGALYELDQCLGPMGFIRVLSRVSAWDAWYLHKRTFN